MAELLFIATTIFVAYVIFVVMGGKKDKPEPIKTETPKVEPPVQQAVQAEQAPPPAAVKTTSKPAPAKASSPKPTAAKPAKTAASKTAVSKSAAASDSLKNPKTGEVAKIPASYAFAKRWIKDALVEEGLLDKVYKNNELDDAANAKIQTALQQLKSLDKYQ